MAVPKFNNFNIISKISENGRYDTYKTERNSDKKKFILKHYKEICLTPAKLINFITKTKKLNLNCISLPIIVNFKNKPFFVLEQYFEGLTNESENFKNFSDLAGRIENSEAWELINNLAKNLNTLNQNNIHHTNLTCDNIFLDKKKPSNPIITNFDSSFHKQISKNDYYYKHPNALKNNTPSEQNTIYSFAVIAYKIITNSFPRFNDKTDTILKNNNPNINKFNKEISKITNVNWTQKNKYPKNEKIYAEIIQDCLNLNNIKKISLQSLQNSLQNKNPKLLYETIDLPKKLNKADNTKTKIITPPITKNNNNPKNSFQKKLKQNRSLSLILALLSIPLILYSIKSNLKNKKLTAKLENIKLKNQSQELSLVKKIQEIKKLSNTEIKNYEKKVKSVSNFAEEETKQNHIIISNLTQRLKQSELLNTKLFDTINKSKNIDPYTTKYYPKIIQDLEQHLEKLINEKNNIKTFAPEIAEAKSKIAQINFNKINSKKINPITLKKTIKYLKSSTKDWQNLLSQNPKNTHYEKKLISDKILLEKLLYTENLENNKNRNNENNKTHISNIKNSLKNLEVLSKKDPKPEIFTLWTDSKIWLANILIYNKKEDQAQNELNDIIKHKDEIIKQTPENNQYTKNLIANAHNLLAKINLKKNKPKEFYQNISQSNEILKKIYQENPQNSLAKYKYAKNIYNTNSTKIETLSEQNIQKNINEALNILKTAKFNPKTNRNIQILSSRFHRQASQIYRDNGNLKKAQTELNSAIEKLKNTTAIKKDAQLIYERNMCMYQKSQLHGDSADHKNEINLATSAVESFSANEKIITKNLPTPIYKEALKNIAEANSNLAYTLENNKQKNDAKKYYKKAISMLETYQKKFGTTDIISELKKDIKERLKKIN